MERLTIPDVRVDERTTRRSVIDVLAVREHAMEIYHQLKVYEDIADLCGGADRLRELAEADKDGRVVVLPCKVGDTAYYRNGPFIIDFEVIGYQVDERGAWCFQGEHFDEETEKTYYCDPSTDKIGQTVFLTRDEAERAMEEKRNG